MVRYLGLSLLMSAAVVGSEDQSCRLPPPNMLTPLEIAAALKIPGWRSVPPPSTHPHPPPFMCSLYSLDGPPCLPFMETSSSLHGPRPPSYPRLPAAPPPAPVLSSPSLRQSFAWCAQASDAAPGVVDPSLAAKPPISCALHRSLGGRR